MGKVFTHMTMSPYAPAWMAFRDTGWTDPGREETEVRVVRYFAVTREHGPAWDDSLPMREQAGWDEHAAFMDGLAEEGFVVLGGPLGDGSSVLLVVDAETEDAVRAGLAADPWARMGLLRVAEVTPWQILLGGSAD